MGIESEVIAAKTIEDKRVKNSIFISLINMVKTKKYKYILASVQKIF